MEDAVLDRLEWPNDFRAERVSELKTGKPAHLRIEGRPAIVIHLLPDEPMKCDVRGVKEILQHGTLPGGAFGTLRSLSDAALKADDRDEAPRGALTWWYHTGAVELLHTNLQDRDEDSIRLDWLHEEVVDFVRWAHEHLVRMSIDTPSRFHLSVTGLNLKGLPMVLTRKHRTNMASVVLEDVVSGKPVSVASDGAFTEAIARAYQPILLAGGQFVQLETVVHLVAPNDEKVK